MSIDVKTCTIKLWAGLKEKDSIVMTRFYEANLEPLFTQEEKERDKSLKEWNNKPGAKFQKLAKEVDKYEERHKKGGIKKPVKSLVKKEVWKHERQG